MDDEQGDRQALVRQANYWLTKRDAGLMTDEDHADLHRWVEASPAHAKAYDRAEALFHAIAALAPSTANPPADRRRPHNRRWMARKKRLASGVSGLVAASFAALVVIGTDLPVRMQADAITETGESERVTLPDGSIALLDSGSALAFDYGPERRVRLLRGQAAFTVTSDPVHPFLVEARSGTTTALGTRFIVSRITPETRVTVTEHSVRVTQSGQSQIVPEGSSVTYRDQGIAAPSSVHVAEIDAWTRGRIRFVNRPLREVVTELGRYHRGYIGMVSGRLGDLPVNGVFSTSDPVGALDIIQRSLGLSSYRIGDRLILLYG